MSYIATLLKAGDFFHQCLPAAVSEKSVQNRLRIEGVKKGGMIIKKKLVRLGFTTLFEGSKAINS